MPSRLTAPNQPAKDFHLTNEKIDQNRTPVPSGHGNRKADLKGAAESYRAALWSMLVAASGSGMALLAGAIRPDSIAIPIYALVVIAALVVNFVALLLTAHRCGRSVLGWALGMCVCSPAGQIAAMIVLRPEPSASYSIPRK